MKIIENITKIMKEKGITAYQLEKDTGIRQTTFSKWKSGSQPAADKLETVIHYLQVSPNEIFGYNDPEDPRPVPEQLTENEKELLKYFRKLPDREQIKEIGRVEDRAKQFQEQQQEYINSGENNAAV